MITLFSATSKKPRPRGQLMINIPETFSEEKENQQK
jgi:hypothetical protein